MAKITLYQFEDCPYCAKVRSKLDHIELEYDKINVPRNRENPFRKMLLKNSGVATVPVLKVENRGQEAYIGESDEIIKYIEENY